MRITDGIRITSVELPLVSEAPTVIPTSHAYYVCAYLARRKNPKKLVEFGTLIGMGALNFALNTSDDCQIFTVDLPSDVAADDLVTSNLNDGDLHWVSISRSRVGDMFKGTRYEKKITQIFANSLTLKRSEQVDDVDMVYIDGGHSYECVSADTKNAFNVLRPKGLVIWDDYCADYPGVVKFVNEVSRTRELMLIQGTKFVAMVSP